MYISALEYAFMSIGGPLFGMSTKFPVCIVSCVAPHVLPLPGAKQVTGMKKPCTLICSSTARMVCGYYFPTAQECE